MIRTFWEDSLTKPPFKVTSAEVAIIFPDNFCGIPPEKRTNISICGQKNEKMFTLSHIIVLQPKSFNTWIFLLCVKFVPFHPRNQPIWADILHIWKIQVCGQQKLNIVLSLIPHHRVATLQLPIGSYMDLRKVIFLQTNPAKMDLLKKTPLSGELDFFGWASLPNLPSISFQGRP